METGKEKTLEMGRIAVAALEDKKAVNVRVIDISEVSVIADYFIVGKGKPENWHRIEGWNWVGVITWVIGVIVSYVLEIDYLGIPVCAVIYLILEHFKPSAAREGAVIHEKAE